MIPSRLFLDPLIVSSRKSPKTSRSILNNRALRENGENQRLTKLFSRNKQLLYHVIRTYLCAVSPVTP